MRNGLEGSIIKTLAYKEVYMDTIECLKKMLEQIEEENKVSEEEEKRYDKFIDLLIDLCIHVANDENYKECVNDFRKHLHSQMPMHKRSFFLNFSKMIKEATEDIGSLALEYEIISIMEKKIADVKEKTKKEEKTSKTKKKK